MQTIPLIYAVLDNLKLHAGPVLFNGDKGTVRDTVPVNSISRLKGGKERGKVLVWDVEGMNRRRFNAPFIEFCKISGNDLWLIEPVYDDADILDAFIGSADKIVFPYRCIRNDSVLKDILEISDNCIPLIECHGGLCGSNDPREVADLLSDTGFHNIMVADMDGSFTDTVWDSLHDICGGLVAYSPKRDLVHGPGIVVEDVFGFTDRLF